MSPTYQGVAVNVEDRDRVLRTAQFAWNGNSAVITGVWHSLHPNLGRSFFDQRVCSVLKECVVSSRLILVASDSSQGLGLM